MKGPLWIISDGGDGSSIQFCRIQKWVEQTQIKSCSSLVSRWPHRVWSYDAPISHDFTVYFHVCLCFHNPSFCSLLRSNPTSMFSPSIHPLHFYDPSSQDESILKPNVDFKDYSEVTLSSVGWIAKLMTSRLVLLMQRVMLKLM